VDVGDRRIGVAVSDELGMIATPLTILQARGRKHDIPALAQLAAREGAVGIVVGLPIRDDGAVTEQTEKAERFARRLAAATDLPVELHDERFTTWEAANRGRGDDDVAAAVLLESFLASPAVTP
jgi:putative Holliday junction resolvase